MAGNSSSSMLASMLNAMSQHAASSGGPLDMAPDAQAFAAQGADTPEMEDAHGEHDLEPSAGDLDGGAGASVVSEGVGGDLFDVNDTNGAHVASTIGSQWGLQVTSMIRDPARNARAGGAKNSDHLPGGAFAADFGGTPAKMAAFAAWARQNAGPGKLFKQVIYGTSDHLDHVHVAWNVKRK